MPRLRIGVSMPDMRLLLQGLQAARALNGFGDALPAFVQPPPPPPKTWAQVGPLSGHISP